MRRLAIACVLASIALGVSGVGVITVPAAAKPGSAGAQIHLGETADGTCRGHKHHFALDRLRDLHVCVVYGDLSGLFVQRLQFTGPDGNVYQVLSVPFATPEVAAPVEGVDVDGVMRPVTSTAAIGPDGVAVHAVLPVAGTAITQSRLTGHWSVELSLNGRVLDRVEFVLREGR
jgi:hypothetical protein